MLGSLHFWIAAIAILSASMLVSFALARYWLSGYEGWPLIWHSATYGFVTLQLGVAGAVAASVGGAAAVAAAGTGEAAGAAVRAIAVAIASVGAIYGAASVSGASAGIVTGMVAFAHAATVVIGGELAIAPAGALGIWFRSVAIRFAATAYYLRTGFWEIPKNFGRTLFVEDFYHPAELVPGYYDHPSFTSMGLLNRLKSDRYVSWKVADAILLIAFFIPAYAYRLSIKATCWVYLPLIYIAHEGDTGISTTHLLDRLGGRKEWARRILALATFTGFIFTTLAFNLTPALPHIIGTKVVSPLEYLFLIDLSTLKIWQIFSLLSALITLYLFFEAGEIRIDYNHVPGTQSRAVVAKKVEWLKILMRLRNIFSTLLIAILALHAILMFSPIIAWLPPSIIRMLNVLYGPFMPPV
jgi:hypothetical protein